MCDYPIGMKLAIHTSSRRNILFLNIDNVARSKVKLVENSEVSASLTERTE